MKKRCTAILLAAVLALSLLPVQVFAAETVPEGWTPIYTWSDLENAMAAGAEKMILMDDINAKGVLPQYVSASYRVYSGYRYFETLQSTQELNGNGHTIYNLLAPLIGNNLGCIRQLSTTFDILPATFPDEVGSFDLYGISGINFESGEIVDCCVRMTVNGTFQGRCIEISGIAEGNSGTIKNCIADMDIDIEMHCANGIGSHATGQVLFAGIAQSNSGIMKNCLALGSVQAEEINQTEYSPGSWYAAGLTKLMEGGTCTDCACALERLSILATSYFSFQPVLDDMYVNMLTPDFSEYECFYSGCLAAADMQLNYRDGGGLIQEDPTYTLRSRDDILSMWDLSGIPGEAPEDIPSTKPVEPAEPAEPDEPVEPAEPEETVEDSFPAGAAEFYYTASNGETKEHYFIYSNRFFYSFDDGYLYTPDMAIASLCLAMSAFTNVDNRVWNNTLAVQDTRRAFNVQRLYETLGFTNAKYVHYDKPLTDTSDRVAFSMAMKYIDNGKGGIDTVIAVPLRGGGYGGEWGSNFNLTYNGYYGNHVGFQRAATDVKMELASYINALKQNGEIRGELKLWITGYSRSAATANILTHDICEASALGGVTLERKNVYAYTFATPAGATLYSVKSSYDPNIFNIISPVDMVPRVAPGAWNYGRYGNTLTLPITNYQKLIDTYQNLSGAEGRGGDLAIMPAQRVLLDGVTDWLFDYIPDAHAYYDRGLNAALSEGMGSLLGKAPSYNQDAAVLTEVIKGTLDIFGTLKTPIKHALLNQLGKEAANFGRAHHPELYLARLETGNLNTVQDFEAAAMSKQIVVPIPISGGEPTPGITVGSANGPMGVFIYDSNNHLLASYEDGVCKSGSATAEMTDMGLVFTLPDGEEDCTLSVGGLGEGEFSFAVFSYDGDHPDGPARTVDFTDFPLERGTVYAFSIPGGTDGDYLGYNEDQSETYAPDYDSEVDEERFPEYAVEISFTDVSPDAYYYDAVLWAVENGITSGTSATTFSPNAACTRAQAVTFLWRAAGSPQPESTRNPFTDVKAGSYYYDAVLWAVEEGITSGTSATTFSPNATCTRAQIVTFLYRSMGSPDVDVQASFRDVPPGAYYADAVSWAADWGVTSGTSATTFSPTASCTRAQIVTFLYRT